MSSLGDDDSYSRPPERFWFRWLKGLLRFVWWVMIVVTSLVLIVGFAFLVVNHPLALGIPTLLFVMGLIGMEMEDGW